MAGMVGFEPSVHRIKTHGIFYQKLLGFSYPFSFIEDCNSSGIDFVSSIRANYKIYKNKDIAKIYKFCLI